MITAILTAALAAPAVAAGWYLAPMAARWRQERRLRSICAVSRTLVLTYDDGPGPELTPRLLDLLDSRGARATFFVLGARAVEDPALVDRIADEGHEVACHTHDHLNAWRALPWRGVADVDAGYRSLAKWVPDDGSFRPPHGKMTLLTWAALRRRRASIGWWTINSGDVQAELPPVATAVEKATRAGGGIVLLHDADREPERHDFVLQSTELLLDAAQENGWSVRTFGDIAAEYARHA